MASPSRDRDRGQLEQEIRTEEYQRLLWRLQKERPFLRQFTTWNEVITFMRSGTSQDPRKDEILRPIFQAHAEDKDPRWRAVLMVIFWPGLESIHFKKRRWDADPDARWATILWVFLEIVCSVDVKQRPDRLVSKIIWGTIHRLYLEYKRSWDRSRCEIGIEQEVLQALVDKEDFDAFSGKVDCCVNFATLGLREEVEDQIRRLHKHVEVGRISEADFLLLVGTKVYGQSIVEYAREAGLRYQTIRKRHQRAEAAMRRVEGERQ